VCALPADSIDVAGSDDFIDVLGVSLAVSVAAVSSAEEIASLVPDESLTAALSTVGLAILRRGEPEVGVAPHDRRKQP